jgi:hypothetical protein
MKRGLVIVGVLLALPVLWIGIGNRLARREGRDAGKRWASSGLSTEEAAARFPKMPSSPAALDVERAAFRLGIRFGHRGPQPPRAEQEAFRKLHLGGFLDIETQRGDDVIEPAPAEIAAFLAAHAEDVAALHAAAGGELYWEQDPSQLLNAPFPGPFGHRSVQNVLAAHALTRLKKGDTAAAMASIEAGWRINAVLRSRPEVISQLMAQVADSVLLGVLRKAPPSNEWSVRVVEHDHRAAMLMSTQMEAWSFSRLARSSDRGTLSRTHGMLHGLTGPGVRTLADQLGGPYVRLAAGNHARALRRIAADMKIEDVCGLDRAALDTLLEQHRSRWNLFSRNVLRNQLNALQASGRRALDAELTQKVLARRALRGKGTMASTVCSAVSWQYEVIGDRVSIGASHDPFTGLGGRPLPLSFTGRRTRRSP